MSMKPRTSSLVVALALLFSLVCCGLEPDVSIAKVTQVIDGDTIIIQGGDRVRYIGMDAPERGEHLYQEANEANRHLVEGKTVRLERDVSNRDRYGRLLRYVYVDETLVNAELVGLGYAWAKAYPPDTRYQAFLEEREGEAKKAKRGIWADHI